MGKERQILSADDTQERDLLRAIQILVPASVSLFDEKYPLPNSLAKEIFTQPRFQRELDTRRQLYQLFQEVFSIIKQPSTEWAEAVRIGELSPLLLQELYQQLTQFITADPLHARLLLYLPVEALIPVAHPSFEQIGLHEFHQAYVKAWLHLLSDSDVRVNFIDGDVVDPELGLGEPERVRKAAHLIPELLARGWMTIDQIVHLAQDADEELLRSLEDGLTASQENFSDLDWQKINQSPLKITRGNAPEGNSKTSSEIALNALTEQLARYADAGEKPPQWLSSRAHWENNRQKEQDFQNDVAQVVAELFSGGISFAEVRQKIITAAAERKIFLSASFSFLEQLAQDDLDQAKAFARQLVLVSQELAQSDPTQKDTCVQGWSHLVRLGVSEASVLADWNETVRDLSQPLPVDLAIFAEQKLAPLQDLLKKIRQDEKFASVFYPFLLVAGSHLKGYATTTSDIDALAFVRPTVSLEDQAHVGDLLKELSQSLGANEKLLAFWVEKEAQGELKLRNLPEAGRAALSALHIQSIMGGLWIGEGEEMGELYGSLLKRYLDLARFGKHQEAVRSHLLALLERDVLQIRLMHKGYQRFYPVVKNQHTEQQESIDGQSVFWDAGYRQVATLLFLSKVFLPDLSEK